MEYTKRLENIPVDELIPYARNSRTHSKAQITKLRSSIREFGFINPVLIDNQRNIIAGHGRVMAAKEEGLTEIPCLFVEHLTEAQKKAYIIADNRLALDAGWDMEMLKIELEELKDFDFDITLTGFDSGEIDLMFEEDHEIKDDDFDSDKALGEIETAVTKSGDIWKLGRHRLLCGDATKLEDIKKLMAGGKANLVVTDPPYNVDYVGKTKDALKIQNDKMSNDSFYQFLLDVYKNLYEATADGGGIYVFHADTEGTNFRKAMVDGGFKLAQCCVWVKNSMVMGRQDYHWQHEPVLYGWKPTGAHNWYTDRKQTTVWNFNRPTVSKEHPTMKPLDLIGYPIKNSSLENCIILDTFGGSGSTMMASEQLNRICYMMELDEKYCDVIIKRWETLTGEKAELINE